MINRAAGQPRQHQEAWAGPRSPTEGDRAKPPQTLLKEQLFPPGLRPSKTGHLTAVLQELS